MNKVSKLLVSLIVVTDLACALPNAKTEKWECAVNLHQGDTGTLSLTRDSDNVHGILSIKRNESVFENEIRGQWINNQVHLKRLLGSNSSETMSGLVLTLGTKKVKIGGRYANEYHGVWSAECDLIPSSAVNEASEVNDSATSDQEPSTSSKVSPNTPNSKDRLRFSAKATHPEGIESLSYFIGDKKIHSCESSECEFTYGPLSQGQYVWRVEAVSKSGITSTKQLNRLTVGAFVAQGKCTISGRAKGEAAVKSIMYLVNLYGPNDESLFRESQGFNDGHYEFTNLPQGRYTLKVDTSADSGVLATPSSSNARCNSNSQSRVDFDFR